MNLWPPKASTTADQIAQWEATERIADNRQNRKHKDWITATGLFISGASFVIGIIFALSPTSSEPVRTMAAGWVGVVLGQTKKILDSD
jgi:hypothetical protein